MRAALWAGEYHRGSNSLWSPPAGSGRLKEAAVLAVAFHFSTRAENRESAISSESSQMLDLSDKTLQEQQVRRMFLQLPALTQSKWQGGSCKGLVLGIPRPWHPFLFQTALACWCWLCWLQVCLGMWRVLPHCGTGSPCKAPRAATHICLLRLSSDQWHQDAHGHHVAGHEAACWSSLKAPCVF